jgi:dGTPase
MSKSKKKCRFQQKLHDLAQRDDTAKRIEEKEKGLPALQDELTEPCRSKFARDRDRIVFCPSYRRLIHKTQLYLPQHDEHRRTRLTHTLEVVQIARAVSRNIGMNEELVEAIAFGHDIGHAPYGHAGEKQIDRFLKGKEPLPSRLLKKVNLDESHTIKDPDFKGDFKHNYQGIRVLTYLEKYHPEYDGLNLTILTLEGILKHSSTKEKFVFPGIENGVFRFLNKEQLYSVSVEGQIVALSDEIAQIVHDLDDALRKRVISIKDVGETVNGVLETDDMRYSEKLMSDKNRNMHIAQIRASLLNHFIRKAIEEFDEALKALNKDDWYKEDGNIKLTKLLLRKSDDPLSTESELKDEPYRQLKRFRDEIILNQFDVNRMDNKGQYLIRKLFDAYLSNPLQLPDSILDQYCQMKKHEMKNTDAFKEWFATKEVMYGISKMMPIDITKLIEHIDGAFGGKDFRRIERDLLDKCVPYMAVDGDFLRCVADHVANMTDIYAREEVIKLYK